jgi:hypothetical protein
MPAAAADRLRALTHPPMRIARLFVLVLVPLLAGCAGSRAQPPVLRPGTWSEVGMETNDDGTSFTVHVDLGRTHPVGGGRVRSVSRFGFHAPVTDPLSGIVYDRQEWEYEFICRTGRARILGFRSYRGDQVVGQMGEVFADQEMNARGTTAGALRMACAQAGLSSRPAPIPG